MKATVSLTAVADQGPAFERGEVLIAEDGEVVLVTSGASASGSTFEGVCLRPAARSVGYFSTSWRCDRFRLYRGTVTLKQGD